LPSRLIAVPALAWSGDFNAGYDPDTGGYDKIIT